MIKEAVKVQASEIKETLLPLINSKKKKLKVVFLLNPPRFSYKTITLFGQKERSRIGKP